MQIKCACCIENKGRILLLQLKSSGDQNGKWGPPGGGLLENEKPIDCVVREVFEETGIKIKIERHLQTIIAPNYKSGYCFIFYKASVKYEQEINIQEEEVSSYAWASRKEIENDQYLFRKTFLKDLVLLAFEKKTSQEKIVVINMISS